MKKLFVCIALLGAGLAAQAQNQDSRWRFYGSLGAASGGEEIVSGNVVTDGTQQVTPFSLRPGDGIQKRIGFDYRLADRFTLQASMGHMSGEPSGYNGGFDFTVVSAELMGFVDVYAGLRLGAGVRKSSAELRGSGVVANWPGNGVLTSKGGAVAELQYMFVGADRPTGKSVPQFGISLRAVTEKFEHGLIGEINGDHREVALVVYY